MHERSERAWQRVTRRQPARPAAAVVVTGDVDADTAADLERRLHEAVPDGRAPRLVVDLAGVPSLSSAGLDVLLRVQERLQARGGRLELRDPSAAVVLLVHEALLEDLSPVEPGRTDTS